jgi:HPt (histidine-containing phosphotransfer) domain-containing protein
MDGFVAKPLDRDVLWSEIERVVRPDSWVDAKVLLAACGGEAAILEALKNAVRDYLPEALGRVEEAFLRSDARALREAAHSLHGMIATVSSSAASAASAIEDAAAEGNVACAGPALEQLRSVSRSILAGIGAITLERLEALAR